MAILTGNDGKVRVGSTDLAAVRSFSIEQTADTIETSSMGTDVRTYVKGMSTWSGSADIYFDETEANTLTATLNMCASGHAVGGAASAIKLVLADGGGDDKWYSGNVLITGFTVNSSMDGMVEASISFQGSGVLSYTIAGSYAA
jgi:predicted secreted protein